MTLEHLEKLNGEPIQVAGFGGMQDGEVSLLGKLPGGCEVVGSVSGGCVEGAVVTIMQPSSGRK